MTDSQQEQMMNHVFDEKAVQNLRNFSAALRQVGEDWRRMSHHISRNLKAPEDVLPGLDKRDRRVAAKPRAQKFGPPFCDRCVDHFDRRVGLDRENAEATRHREAEVVDDKPVESTALYKADGCIDVEVKADAGRRPEGQSFNIVIHCSPHSSVGDTPKASGSGPDPSCDCGSEPAGGADA